MKILELYRMEHIPDSSWILRSTSKEHEPLNLSCIEHIRRYFIVNTSRTRFLELIDLVFEMA